MTILSVGCVTLNKISTHQFNSGFYNLKTPGNKPDQVYAKKLDDSIIVYQLIEEERKKSPDTSSSRLIRINEIKPGNYFYNSTLIRKSIDVDLSTILVKFRPSQSNVPGQLNANVNAALYIGIRRDFFRIVSHVSHLKEVTTRMHQIGFDVGLFAGLGIAPVNPTVTTGDVNLEYDGIVFQKGIAAFFTLENSSIGITLGFDNLLDDNKNSWIFNQKPWIGIVIGIATF